MFRVAYRSSSGALNCVCSLWFIYTCGDRLLSRLSRKWEREHLQDVGVDGRTILIWVFLNLDGEV